MTVNEDPISTPRPRFSRRSGHSYMPSRAQDAQHRIREAAMKCVPEGWTPTTEPVAVMITAYLQPPKTMPKKDRGVKRPGGPKDWDNLGKTVSDGLEKVVYANDSQIVLCRVEKLYAWEGMPRWEITVRPVK